VPVRRAVAVPSEVLAAVQDLYDRALYLQAFQVATAFAPLLDWSGADAEVLAARLAGNLGADRRSRALQLRTGRAHRDHPEAGYFYARAVQERFGPLAAWTWLRTHDAPASASAATRADWCSLRAAVAADLRDFVEAERQLALADEMAPGLPWSLVVRAGVLQRQDRPDEALATALRCLEASPWYRPGVQCAAELLLQSARSLDALALLAEADRRCESNGIAGHLSAVQADLGRWHEAEASLDRFEQLSPLLERAGACWLAGRRSDAAWELGRREDAIAHARVAAARSPFHRAIADRLEEGRPARAVRLPVPFVRQHHLTCSPATLASLAAYLGRPIAHLALAERISYEGTPGRKEREWADGNGWVAREFRVTWETTLALLERGIPFSLVTVGPGSAHEQAIVGFDEARGAVLVRDPSDPLVVEYLGGPLLEQQAAFGPRGFVVLPVEQADRLAGVDLPDAPLYDVVYALERALDVHDREAARAARERLEADAPGHLLGLHADRLLAAYDADNEKALAWADAMLARFPDVASLVLARLACLRNLGREGERSAELASLCARPSPDPSFLELHAEILCGDARRSTETARLLRRARRIRRGDAAPLAVTARLLLRERRFEEALAAYRFASCLDDRNEDRIGPYFAVARQLDRADEALRYLRERCARLQAVSSQPAGSLFWALEELGRADLAFAELDAALARPSADGSIALLAADAHARYGHAARAAELLESARPRARRASWLRAAAAIAAYHGEHAEAAARWREVLAAEPLALDAHRELAPLIAATEGAQAAERHLRAACERHPHHVGLHHAWLARARLEGPEAAEPVVRHLLALHPTDAWSHRELALVLTEQRRFEEAFAAMATARELEPASPSWHCVHGVVLAGCGRLEEARAAFEEALRLDINHVAAVNELAALLDTAEQGRAAWTFVKEELVRQVVEGGSLLAFRERARSGLAPDEILATLREIHARRPDLWQSWSAVVDQLAAMQRLGEAFALAREAIDRFPLVASLWSSRAEIHRLDGQRALEREALLGVRRIDAADGGAIRRLAVLVERDGDAAGAGDLLAEGIARSPLDATIHGALAGLLWRTGRRPEALARIGRALELAPGWEWAWERHAEWSAEAGAAHDTAGLARELARRRPGALESWMTLGRLLTDAAQRGERLQALDRAIALSPRLLEAHDLKATALAEGGDLDAARAACRPEAWGEAPPVALRGREAWLEAQRGNVPLAIERMRAVVAGEPSYVWGWTCLADWHRECSEDGKYLEASEALVRERPTDSVPYGYRADARQRTGDTKGALADLIRAVELDPDYFFARGRLVDVLLEQGSAARARDLMRRHPRLSPDDAERSLEVRVAAAEGRRSDALSVFDGLAASIAPDATPVAKALAALEQAGWADDARTILRRAALTPAAVHAAVLSLPPLAAARDARAREAAVEALPAGPGRRAAWEDTLEALAGQGFGSFVVRFLDRRREELRADVVLWALAGRALFVADERYRAREWMEDWRARAGVRPWMLYNLGLVLRRLRHDAAAEEVARAALALDADHTSDAHALWAALDDAVGGRFDEARALLTRGSRAAAGDQRLGFLAALGTALVALGKGESGFGAFRSALAAARAKAPWFARERELAHVYFRCARRGARVARGPLALLWSLGQWMQSDGQL
jgi:tetratricopeptide (TPR) repeat protein